MFMDPKVRGRVCHGGQGNGGGRYVQKYQRSQEGREQKGQECVSLCFFFVCMCARMRAHVCVCGVLMCMHVHVSV